MYKILIVIAIAFFVSGCTKFKITGTMCNNIHQKAGEPVPQECQAYNKKKADKAFFKTKNEQIHSAEDVIKFNKETNDK